jgi:hypothetical protein
VEIPDRFKAGQLCPKKSAIQGWKIYRRLFLANAAGSRLLAIIGEDINGGKGVGDAGAGRACFLDAAAYKEC